jgi:flagellar assembly protein FliH
MERYLWARTEVTLSDQGGIVTRWQAPYFDKTQKVASAAPPSQTELLALAQASGFQEGRQEGLEAGRAEAQEIVNTMLGVAEQMAQPFRSMDQLVAKELTQMAMQLAREIARRELAIDSSVVTEVVAEIMSMLSDVEGEITIFLNPVDATKIAELAPEILAGISWKLVETPDLLPGGCRVKTPISFIDASVEAQMDKVLTALLDSCEAKLGC